MSDTDSYTMRVEELNRRDVAAWLVANDIDLWDVPLHSDIFLETGPDGMWLIRYAAYLRNGEGHRYVDRSTRDVAVADRSVPLLIDPPISWLTTTATQT